MAASYILVESALEVLRKQKIQAEKDLIKLEKLKKDALKDPFNLVEILMSENKRNPYRDKIPKSQNVVLIPPLSFHANLQKRKDIFEVPTLQIATELRDDGSAVSSVVSGLSSAVTSANTSPCTSPITSYSQLRPITLTDNNDFDSKNFPARKPRSESGKRQRAEGDGGKPWTEEENARLGELLLIYSEDSSGTSHSRMKKITSALGGRTLKQVINRVQSHFSQSGQDISQATLNQPKQRSKSSSTSKPSQPKTSKSGQPFYSNRITGAQYLVAPMMAMSSEEDSDIDLNLEAEFSTVDNNVDKKIRREEVVTANAHRGYTCDSCQVNPIVGTRWNCSHCQDVDLCDHCKQANTFSNGFHVPSHPFTAVMVSTSESNATTNPASYLGWD